MLYLLAKLLLHLCSHIPQQTPTTMSILTRDDIEATTSILADIAHVDREIEVTIRRIRDLKKNRRSLTEELEELHIQQQEKDAEGKEDFETLSPPPPSCQNKCDGTSPQVSEEQRPREPRSSEVASLSTGKEEGTTPHTSLITVRSRNNTEGDGLVQNQVHPHVA